MKKKSFNFPFSPGFTLMEILIVVAIIVILATIFFAGNISSSFQKARDNRRKQDLNKLMRILEDYYNDNQHYPEGNPNGTIKDAPWGYDFFSYPITLPKDPFSKPDWPQYYYQTGAYVQDFYSIYARLEYQTDLELQKLDCVNGCGPVNLFNYYVTSPNTVLIGGLPNGQAPQGGNPLFGEPDPPPSVTPTSAPVPPTATPTINLTPPPSNVTPPIPCAHNQYCNGFWCGAAQGQGGVNCGISNPRCNYESIVIPIGWGCGIF